MFQRVDRFSILANFEVKLYEVTVRISHFSDFLSFGHCLSLFHQKFIVMGVSAEVRVVMFDNDHLAIAAQPLAAVNHFARSGCSHRLSRLACNINTLGAFRERFGYFAFCWPDPFDTIIISNSIWRNSFLRRERGRINFDARIFLDRRNCLYDHYRRGIGQTFFQLDNGLVRIGQLERRGLGFQLGRVNQWLWFRRIHFIGLGCSRGRRRRLTQGEQRWARQLSRWEEEDLLPDMNSARIGNIIPFREIPWINTLAHGNTVKRVPFFYDVNVSSLRPSLGGKAKSVRGLLALG